MSVDYYGPILLEKFNNLEPRIVGQFLRNRSEQVRTVQALRLRPANPIPNRPIPKSARVPGSGTETAAPVS